MCEEYYGLYDEIYMIDNRRVSKREWDNFTRQANAMKLLKEINTKLDILLARTSGGVAMIEEVKHG